VQVPGSSREIMLQRAAMPRFIDGVPIPALDPVTGRTETVANPQTPYYINEEEIPRAGAIVTQTWQRARWYDGKTVMWQGRRKITGRGEGASNVMFDQVKEKGDAGLSI